MDIKALRAKPVTELVKHLAEEQEKLHDLRLKVASRQLKNVREIRESRRTIARLQTLLRAARNV